MEKQAIGLLAIACGLALSSFVPMQAQAALALPALASYDWSVNSPHSLESNPPSADLVWTFVTAATGSDPRIGHLCSFRFANLRGAGDLSLVVSIDWGGTGGCNETAIFDRTPSGFDAYTSWAGFGDDSVQDIDHDGRYELVLDTRIGPPEPDEVCSWPLIIAWTGSGYSDVSPHYKRFYRNHLKDLQKQLVAEPADWTQAVKTPASEPTAFILSPGKSSYSSADPSKALVNNPDTLVPAPTTAPSEASVPDLGNQTDYFCARLELAKTEGFLGIHSDATISYAIKASESDDSDKRELAAYLFSFIRTPEATKDLKGLAADTNPVVAEVANERLSAQSEDLNHYAVNYEPDNSLARIAPSHSSH